MEEHQIKLERTLEGCRFVRLAGTIFLAAYILYGLIVLPLWVHIQMDCEYDWCKFDPSIDGWVIGSGIVTLWILVNSLFREIPRGSYRERRRKWLHSQKELHMAARMAQ